MSGLATERSLKLEKTHENRTHRAHRYVDTGLDGFIGATRNTSLSNVFRVDLNFSRHVYKKVIFRASIHRSHIYHF